MTLLRDIQNAALDSSVDLADLLRKCKVLAARLKHPAFADWVGHELNGYPDAASLPEYRRVQVESLGKFVGPFGSGIDNARIPAGSLPDNLKHHANEALFFESVSSLSALAADDGSTLQAKWNADVVGHVARKHRMYRDMVLIDAWRVISSATVAGILDTVRTRILDFVLALEAENPESGEIASGAPANVPSATVTTIYNTTINNGQANIGTVGDASISVRWTPSVRPKSGVRKVEPAAA